LSQGTFGTKAKLFVESTAPPGTVLALDFDVQARDKYDRTLAYVYLPDGTMLNEALLRAGMAVVSVYPPNVRHVDRFRAVADSARLAARGLWSGSAFDCLPADYRAGRCQ
jgi:micrococcal nuclease